MAPQKLFKRGGYAPSDSPANARGAPGDPWRPSFSVDRLVADAARAHFMTSWAR